MVSRAGGRDRGGALNFTSLPAQMFPHPPSMLSGFGTMAWVCRRATSRFNTPEPDALCHVYRVNVFCCRHSSSTMHTQPLHAQNVLGIGCTGSTQGCTSEHVQEECDGQRPSWKDIKLNSQAFSAPQNIPTA